MQPCAEIVPSGLHGTLYVTALGEECDMTLELRPLSPTTGVELLGVDLRQDQPERVRQRVRRALLEHHLVLVRGQELSLAEQLAFAEWFGAVAGPDANFQPEGATRIETYMSNVVGSLTFTGRYMPHRDDTHRAAPCRAMSLYAQEVSRVGGQTRFYDAEAAYERLSPGLRARIDGLRAVHIGPGKPDEIEAGETQIAIGFRATGGSPANRQHQSWPVVLEHPETGRPILFIDEPTVHSIEGLDLAEGDALLAELRAALEDPAVRYDHTWEVHDVVVWDNLSLLHERTPFPAEERRTLRKLLIAAPAPAMAG
jgi:taurine dioxygenase